jgi:hypothetical protein
MNHSAGQERKPNCREVRRRAQVNVSMYRHYRRAFSGLMTHYRFYNFFQEIEKNLQESADGLRLCMLEDQKRDGLQNQ